MSEEENTQDQPKSANDIIQQDNFDERNDRTKEPAAIHPTVAARLEREKNFSNDTTRISESIPEQVAATEESDKHVEVATKQDLENLKTRIEHTVGQINDQFAEIGSSLTAVVNEVRSLSEKDKTYKNAFVSLENRLTAILRKLNS